MPDNLLAALPAVVDGEVFETLLEAGALRIERITSHNARSPETGWYEQGHAEWVALIAGQAAIAFEDEPGELLLAAGDYLLIEAQRRHRVLWTDPKGPTVWLALHLPGDTAVKA